MAYALRKSDYEINAAIVDALTILIQSWEKYARKTLKISIIHILVCLATFTIFFIPCYFVSKSLGISVFPGLGLAFVLMLTVKIAFFDSYVLTKTVCDFLTIASETQIASRNYAKLDNWSTVYKSLRQSAEKAAEKAEDEADKAERAAQKAQKNAEKEKNALPAPESEPAAGTEKAPQIDDSKPTESL